MFTQVYDPTHVTLLTAVSGKMADAEWQATYDALIQTLEDTQRTRLPTIIITFSDPSTERPNANWRKKLAETRNLSDKSIRAYFVLVTQSTVLRGVMMAINWIIPKADTEENFAADTFEGAYAWLQKRTGQPLLHLPRMHKELLQKIEQQKLSAIST